MASVPNTPSILIAPACFKGSLSAGRAGQLIRQFLQERLKESTLQDTITLDVCPIADGGDDTLAVLCDAVPGFLSLTTPVSGPLPTMRVEARYLLHPEKKIAVIEAAQSHGLKLLPESQRDAMAATSYGVGELINAALAESKAQNIPLENLIVTVGGSASTDGGFGALQALGVTFRDAQGEPITQPLSGESLATVQEIGWPGEWPYTGKVTIATDVITPLLGPDGSASLFAPQKGASPTDCERLEQNLTAAAQQLSAITGKDYQNFPGVGAAGGLAYGLCHLPRAGILSGSDWIADLLQLKTRIQQARLIITGEGRLDATTFSGKATGNLMLWAKDTPLWFLCGQIEPGLTFPDQVIVSPLTQHTREATPLEPPDEALTLAFRQPETALQKTLAAHWPAIQELLRR